MTILAATLALSLALCGIYLRLARRWQILDRPNERSSHKLPTPHGGGVPLLIAFSVGAVFAAWQHQLGDADYGLILLVALFLMGLCVVDDLRGLSVRLRFALYGICCLVTAALLIPVSAPGLLLVPLAALAMLWLLNLYNFMDGIDGFASIQCVLAAGAAAALARYNGGSYEYLLFCLLLAAAHSGFLVWNWPPARLFMGDAGSVPTGYLLAALALLGAVRGELPLSCWLILLAVFITDASWTLVWRILSGQNFTQAHRLHAYQRLSRHWSGHLPVDLLLLAIAVFWLFPLSAMVLCFPRFEFLLVILAYFPLLAGMAKMRKFA